MSTWYKPRCETRIAECVGENSMTTDCEIGWEPQERWFALSRMTHNRYEIHADYYLEEMGLAAKRTSPRAVAAYEEILARHQHVAALVRQINADTLRVYREAFFTMGVCFTNFPIRKPSVVWGGSKPKEEVPERTYCLHLRRAPGSRPKLRTPRLLQSVVKPWTPKQESQS